MTGAAAPLPLGRRILFSIVPAVAFLLLLAAAEGLVRAAMTPVRPLELFVTFPRQQAMFVDRQHVGIFEADPLLFWRLVPGLRNVFWDGTVVTTNAEGLRYARPVGAKPAGTVRVVCLGDSVTFGFRVPRVFANRPEVNPEWLPYPALLERALRAANPGRAIEVVPLAVPGYSSHQGRLWLQRDIDRLAPDLLVACFGWNDIDRRPRSDAETITSDWVHVTSRRLVSRSQALLHVLSWLNARHGAPEAPPSGADPRGVMRVPRERYVLNLRAIVAVGREHGARVAVIGPVYRDNVAHPPEGDEIGAHRAALRAAMVADGVPYLEIPELTESSWPANDRLFEEHIHPNHRGHRLMAERLQALIAADGLLPMLSVPVPAATAP
jgi:lysophospholipase L1-like esterase